MSFVGRVMQTQLQEHTGTIILQRCDRESGWNLLPSALIEIALKRGITMRLLQRVINALRFRFSFQIDGWARASQLWMCQSAGLRMRDGVLDDSSAWLTGLPLCLPHASCILMLPRWDWRCRDRRWRRWGVEYQDQWQANINHTSC